MNYSNMIEEKNLKKTFIIATLCSTIIGTFTTGLGLYERVGQKRQQKKKDAGQDEKITALQKELEDSKKEKKEPEEKKPKRRELEDSLQESGPMIRKEYNRDFARFGDRFARGDSITENQLQGQIITLQGTVIGLLENAVYTGRLDNIGKLYNASELAREGSLTALQQQYQRMSQAAPIQRPMAIRRISSNPTVTSKQQKSLPPASHAGSAVAKRAPSVLNDSPDEPLFCKYSYELQRDGRQPLEAAFLPGGSNDCRACGALLEVEQGRAWKVNREVVREKVSTPEYDEEIVEDRTYLINNRFIIKCHRGAGGFACVLCARYRDKDTLLESPAGLVRHVWQKHEVEEYQDPDIREIGKSIDKIRDRHEDIKPLGRATTIA